MNKFIIASNNAKKIKEIERILNPLGIEALSAEKCGFNLDEVEETGTTFAQNAYLKAKAAFDKTGMPAVADDSGLEVDALNGRPGVYTARYGGEGLTSRQRYMLLLDEMKDVEKKDRTARFVSEICCILDDNTVITSRGECEGEIAFSESGDDGFGYDPIFIEPKSGKSFAQLCAKEKDSISHRGKALEILKEKLEKIREK